MMMMIKSNVPNPMYISAPLLSFFASSLWRYLSVVMTVRSVTTGVSVA